MSPEQAEPTAAIPTSDAAEDMARYGITCTQVDQFFYGGYRYTNLADAIAEARRHPTGG